MTQKIVIWGYPPDIHTHSYIHLGFAKAFSEMDYDVTWYEDSPDYSQEDLSDAIVITENNCCKYMPIVKSSKYFVHNLEDGFISQSRFDHDNIYNLLVYHEGYNWSDDIAKNGEYSWFDPKTNTLVIMWATDLLPNEIDEQEVVLFDEDKTSVNYIGTINPESYGKFNSIVSSDGKTFRNYGGYTGEKSKDTLLGFVSETQSISLTRDSYLNFDIRPQIHLNNGYVPCRIFKTMSYGCWIGSNSEKLNNFFEGRITAHSDLKDLYLKTKENSKNATLDILKDNKNFIRENHTYINRANSILSVV